MEEATFVSRQSHSQRRLWFLQALAPRSTAYNAQFALWLRGDLDRDALCRAIDALVVRHEALRTTFGIEKGEEVQRVHPFVAGRCVVEDLRGLPSEARNAQARALARKDATTPFDLETGPLFRVRLLQLSERENVLLLGLHHIIYDGWSLDVLLTELGQLYGARTSGLPLTLPPLPINYADFASWERENLQDATLEQHLAYWQQQLGGELAPLQLPMDKPRPAVPSFRGDIVELTIGGEDLERLKAIASQERATLFMAVLAVFQAQLHRYTRQADIRVGIAHANRAQAELDNVFGAFVNLLVIRTDFSGGPTYREILRQVRRASLDAFTHAEAPFEQVVKRLGVERSLSQNPLCEVGFVFQPKGATLVIPGLEAELEDLHCGGAKLDLTLTVWEQDGGLTGRLEYSTDLFEAKSAQQLSRHFQTLLANLARSPDAPVERAGHISGPERDSLLSVARGVSTPGAWTLHGLVEEQARATPQAVALVFESGSMTYEQLNARAERVAAELERRGVRPDDPVALVLERSPELIVAMLGVLKAGAAFLPVDPSYPSERIALMLGATGERLVLTVATFVSRILVKPDRAVLLDALPEVKAPRRARPVLPSQVAYLLFTSGSTGVPKGVMVPHEGAANLAVSARKAYGAGPGVNHLQWASPSFDVAIGDVFVTLAAGGTLHLARREALLPGPELIALLGERRIHSMLIVPSALAVLPAAGLAELRTLLVAGEKCTPELFERWGKHRRFLNGYGPTEASILASIQDVARTPSASVIGRPVDNTAMYVLDEKLELVSRGGIGELYIGGAGLARGYWQRPELTADRFVPNPFGAPGSRLYRTGDLIRFGHDDSYDYIGRRDLQVKVRGHRIELGEIEAVLRSHANVKNVAVVAREEAQRHSRLIAYVAPDRWPFDNSNELELDLRKFVAERLPSFMMPSAFLLLEALPLNGSGKLDRAALPAPEQPGRGPSESAQILLASDHPRQSNPSFQSELFRFALTSDDPRALVGEPLSDPDSLRTAIAAFALFVSRYSGVPTPKVWVGLDGERLLKNAIELDTADDPSFVECVRRMKSASAPQESSLGFVHEARLLSTGRCVANRLELLLLVRKDGQGYEAAFEYDVSLFERSTVERMARHFTTLLSAVRERPEVRVSRLSYLSKEERVAFGQPVTDSPAAATTVHALFEAHAARHPDAPAVCLPNRTWSYRELDERSNRVASALVRRGLNADDVVGVAAGRSVQLIIAVLGILKAGGAYLALSTKSPRPWLEDVLRLAQVKTVVTVDADGAFEQLAANIERVSLTKLESEENSLAPPRRGGPNSLAYVVFTSGSTGAPKGVLVPHRGVVHFIQEWSTLYPVGPGVHMLHWADPAFDAWAGEALLALGAGAALEMLTDADLASGASMAALLKDRTVHVMQVSPATLAASDPNEFSTVKTLVCCGEKPSPDLLQRWTVGKRFINGYGPSETSIGVAGRVSRATDSPSNFGFSIQHTRFYVMDEGFELVGHNVPGELYISGISVARGYAQRADLTAERFLPNPFGPLGSRLYRTGDVVRARADGSFEFVGRVDHQVKIRGYRVEPGQIEAVLSAHPDVREAVVIPWGEGAARRLVAYAVPRRDVPTDWSDTLKRFVEEKLPAFMRPSTWVILSELPRTGFYKVDRKALPPPDGEAQTASGSDEMTPEEQSLAKLWVEVLGVSSVQRDDHFFNKGGDSILAILLVSRARSAGFSFSVQDVFAHPTLQALAAKGKSIAAPVQREASGRAALTPIQQWFFQQDLSSKHHFNQAVVLELTAAVEAGQLESIFQALASHHEALRLKFVKTAEGWEQSFEASVPGPLTSSVDLSQVAAEHLEVAWQAEVSRAQGSLSPETGVVCRGFRYRMGSHGRDRLLWVAHHLVVDFVSWGILLTDLASAFGQLSAGRSLQLPSRTTSFQAWSEVLSQAASSPQTLAEVPYWISQAPSADAGGTSSGGPRERKRFTLDAASTQMLLGSATVRLRAQPQELVLTALTVATQRLTGRIGVSVELENHGREPLEDSIDISRTVGWFTSLFPVRLSCPIDKSVARQVGVVKELLRAIPRNGIGYGLARYLGPSEARAKLSAQPRAELLFTFFGNEFGGALTNPYFRVAPYDVGPSEAPDERQRHRLAVAGFIGQQQLHLDILFDPKDLSPDTIDRWGETVIDVLQASTRENDVAGAVSPSDFPMAGLDEGSLRDLLDEVSEP